MKKFVSGMACGALIALSTGIVAASSIEAILFPSEIKIHTVEGTKEWNGNQPILNYNHSVYVPLRSFAEMMGAKVHYTPPNEEESSLPVIDIHAPRMFNISEKELKYQDEKGYVSIGYIQPVPGSETEKMGVIKFNKDLDDHDQLVLIGKSGNGSKYFFIDQQNVLPPKAGDIRSFRAYLPGETDSYQVVVRKQPYYAPDINKLYGVPIAFLFSPPPVNYNYKAGEPIQGPYGEISGQFTGYMRQGDIIPFQYGVFHTGTSNIIVEPFTVELEVKRLNPDRTETVVYSQQSKTIEGRWETGYGYNMQILWDMTDDTGQPLQPGTYRITLKPPQTIHYRVEGSEEVLTHEVVLRYRFNEYLVNIE